MEWPSRKNDKWLVAVAVLAMATLAAAAIAFAPKCAHDAPQAEAQCHCHDKKDYNGLYHVVMKLLLVGVM